MFEKQGIKPAEFLKAYESSETQQKLSMAGRLFSDYGLRSVPIFIVDGRYVTDVARAGSPANLLAVIEYLANQAKANKTKAEMTSTKLSSG